MNNLPDNLFEWIENIAWENLNASQKLIVNEYLTEPEYTNLHQVFMSTQAFYKVNQDIELPTSVKQTLDKTFKTKHQKTLLVPLWQAAAVLIAMLSGFIFYSIQTKSNVKTIVNSIHDTLYVPQYVESKNKQVDTVVIYKYLNNSSSKSYLNNAVVKLSETGNENYLPVAQIRTLGPEEIKNSIRNIKNKSMQEDTLYRKIGYASI